MGRDRSPKHKLSRREGKDLFGTGGESLQRRLTQLPGMHGRSGGMGGREKSNYYRQLREKQKVKRMYGVRESQFRRFFGIASRTRGLTGVVLLQMLERRLDNVLYRLGYAKTRPQARQMVVHGHVMIDGQKVDVPSFLAKPGMAVTLSQTILAIPDVKELSDATPPIPGWLERTPNGGTVIRDPERHEIDADIQESAIVEFYSR